MKTYDADNIPLDKSYVKSGGTLLDNFIEEYTYGT